MQGGGSDPAYKKRRISIPEEADTKPAAMDPAKVISISITTDRDSGVTDTKITALLLTQKTSRNRFVIKRW